MKFSDGTSTAPSYGEYPGFVTRIRILSDGFTRPLRSSLKLPLSSDTYDLLPSASETTACPILSLLSLSTTVPARIGSSDFDFQVTDTDKTSAMITKSSVRPIRFFVVHCFLWPRNTRISPTIRGNNRYVTR